MQPKSVEIDEQQVRIHPGHELDRDVLHWIDETLPHTFRYMGLPMHHEIEEWARANTSGIWYMECNHVQDGVIRFAYLPDAEKFKENFDHRIW